MAGASPETTGALGVGVCFTLVVGLAQATSKSASNPSIEMAAIARSVNRGLLMSAYYS
jgi:hypothetical protein